MMFCLRGGAEHRELKYSQFKFQEVQDPVDSSEMVMSVQYSEYGSKHHQGLVHQVHLDNKVIRHYANSALGERCFVRLLELYVSKLPELAKKRDIFYCKPKTNFQKDMRINFISVCTVTSLIFTFTDYFCTKF